MASGNKNMVSGKNPPLHNWGIFIESYWKRIALAQDRVALDEMSVKQRWSHEWNFRKVLFEEKRVVIVTNPSLSIVFASSNMAEMNGYNVVEVIGQRPSMFQGTDTDEQTKRTIREAIAAEKKFQVSILNYRKYGQPYHCDIEGHPVYNNKQELVNFIAFEKVSN